MEIKPPGSGGPLPPVSDTNPSIKRFSNVSRPAPSGTTQAGPALKAVTAEFRKADLQDPAKVDQMLSRCAGELLESVLPRVDAKISPAGTADLKDWLQSDPVLRGKLLNYLERVLS
jgi:hypothetical protein